MPLVWNNEHLHGERHLAFHYTHSPLRAAPLDPNSDVEYSEKLAKVSVRQSRGAIPPATHLDLFGGVHEPKRAFDTLGEFCLKLISNVAYPPCFRRKSLVFYD